MSGRGDSVALTRDANGGSESVSSAYLDFSPILEGIPQGRG